MTTENAPHLLPHRARPQHSVAGKAAFVVLAALVVAGGGYYFVTRRGGPEKTCHTNLRRLVAAFEQYALVHDQPPTAIDQVYGPTLIVTELPVCPAGGTYGFPAGAKTGDRIQCSVHGSMADLRAKLK